LNCKNCNDYCCKNEMVGLFKSEVELLKKIKPDLNLKDFGEILYLEPPCPFFKDNKCSIYEQRPIICRSFPVFLQGSNNKNYIKKHSFCPKHRDLDFFDGSEMFIMTFFAYVGVWFNMIAKSKMTLKQLNKEKIFLKVWDQKCIKKYESPKPIYSEGIEINKNISLLLDESMDVFMKTQDEELKKDYQIIRKKRGLFRY